MVRRYNGIPQFEVEILNDSGAEYGYRTRAEKYEHLEGSSHPFDDVFKSLKVEHIRLFIPLINEFFGTDYSWDEKIELLSPDGVFLTPIDDGTVDVKGRVSDMYVRIRDKTYIIECQSYNDSDMAIRLIEYAFLGALRNVKNENGVVYIDMPRYTVIYIKSNSNTPEKTKIKVSFPSGQVVDYYSDNVIMSQITREKIVEKKLYALVPFYMLRYENKIMKDESYTDALEEDIRYICEHLNQDTEKGILNVDENKDIKYLSNNLIRNVYKEEKEKFAERLVDIMGGNVLWLPSVAEREGRAQGIAIGENRGISKMTEALKLMKYGGCTTVEDLLDKGVSREIAEAVLSI